jgi:hypothetical protein
MEDFYKLLDKHIECLSHEFQVKFSIKQSLYDDIVLVFRGGWEDFQLVASPGMGEGELSPPELSKLPQNFFEVNTENRWPIIVRQFGGVQSPLTNHPGAAAILSSNSGWIKILN